MPCWAESRLDASHMSVWDASGDIGDTTYKSGQVGMYSSDVVVRSTEYVEIGWARHYTHASLKPMPNSKPLLPLHLWSEVLAQAKHLFSLMTSILLMTTFLAHMESDVETGLSRFWLRNSIWVSGWASKLNLHLAFQIEFASFSVELQG